MNPSPPSLAKEIDLSLIRPFIRRARDKAGFQGVKDSIKKNGVLIPVQVRDLGKKDGNGHRYELICGEGRCTALEELGRTTVPAFIVDIEPVAQAARFMTENLMRKSLPWAEKGRMIKHLMDRGMGIREVCEGLSISEGLGRKYLALISGGVEGIETLAVNVAEKLVTVPARDQKIVMEVARETGQSVAAIVEKAKKVRKSSGEGWTKASLQQALRKDDETLKRQRDSLKLKRLHHALGPVNIRTLLKIPAFVKAAKALNLNLTYFQP